MARWWRQSLIGVSVSNQIIDLNPVLTINPHRDDWFKRSFARYFIVLALRNGSDAIEIHDDKQRIRIREIKRETWWEYPEIENTIRNCTNLIDEFRSWAEHANDLQIYAQINGQQVNLRFDFMAMNHLRVRFGQNHISRLSCFWTLRKFWTKMNKLPEGTLRRLLENPAI